MSTLINFICGDCHVSTLRISHYVGGAQRCLPCAEAFNKANRDRRDAAEAQRRAEHLCDGSTGDSCELCCQHDERDHGFCLDCGDEEDPGAAIDRAMDALEDR